MVSKKYPNNACCYYVSWDNVPLTAGLFLAENLVFTLIWLYELDPMTLASNLLIYWFLFKLVEINFKFKACTQCCSSCDEQSCVKKTFERVYESLNDFIAFLKKFSNGPKALVLVFALLVISWMNLCVWCTAWFVAMWSFLQPGLIKFAGIDLVEIWEMVFNENPFQEQIQAVWEMIPRASSVKKSE